MFSKLFKKTSPEALNENFFTLINNDWMLITAGEKEHFNTMTASWGTTGILWNKPIAVCFIRPHRYTFEFAERYDHYTLSFFNKNHKEILNYCGAHSGRTVDKTSKTGLKPVETPAGSISFEQSRLIIECKKIYADYIKEENFLTTTLISKHYPKKDFHRFYIGEIVGCYEHLPANPAK